jgi:hypothetical protein
MKNEINVIKDNINLVQNHDSVKITINCLKTINNTINFFGWLYLLFDTINCLP